MDMQGKWLAVAIGSALMALSGAASAQTVVRLGHVGPLTGASAHLGKDNENGAKLAIQDLNAKGVKIGGQAIKFELVGEDDGADPKQGAAAAQKLVDLKVAGVVGHLNSSTTIPASRIYHDAGIAQISPSSTNPQYTLQGFNTAYRVVANDSQLGGTLGRYAVNEVKAKNIAIITDRTAYGQGVADEFEKAAIAAGAKVVGKEFTTEKSTDFSAILTKLRGAKPELVFFGGMDSVGGPMLRQMKQLGLQARFMGGDGICTSELPKLAGTGMADGQVICAEAGGVGPEGEARMNEWRGRYQKAFNTEVKLYAPYVYDAMMVLVGAMERAGSTDPKAYIPELKKTAYDGVTGKIAFDDRGDIKDGTLTLFTFKGGQRDKIAVVR